MEQVNWFRGFRKSVYGFCGDEARESIDRYFKRGLFIEKTDFTGETSSRLVKDIERLKTANHFKPLKEADLKILGNLGSYAKSGGIDGLHAFLIVNNAETHAKGIYYIQDEAITTLYDGDTVGILNDIMQKDTRGDYLNIDDLPALLIIVAEQDVKMVKYKDLGYEYCLLEAGMMLQNLYVAGVGTTLAIRPMGSYNKTEAIKHLGISLNRFTPMIAVIIGSKDEQ